MSTSGHDRLIRVPAFDALAERKDPFDGFGSFTLDPPEFRELIRSTASEARRKIAETFKRETTNDLGIAVALDEIISDMWKTGWTPSRNSFDLFVTDFGVVLLDAVRHGLGGRFVLRSEILLDHTSIWWGDRRLEVFPFHRLAKSLATRDDNSIKIFVEGIDRILKGSSGQPD